jgi:cytochrome c peroxidase
MGIGILICGGVAAGLSVRERVRAVRAETGYGEFAATNKLGAAYAKWKTAHEQSGGDRGVVMTLGWSKGLSDEYSTANGVIKLNLVDGEASATVSGLDAASAELWLVDNQEGADMSVAPEKGDKFLHLGTLAPRAGDASTLELHVKPGKALQRFEVDLVAVTRAGTTPVESKLLYGSAPLYQRLYTQNRMAQETRRSWNPIDWFVRPAHAVSFDAVATLDALVVQGSNLFFNQQFNGNGRTCGTCHRAEDNLTIDPAFIATLPQTDALFVAETNPALAQNFEKPDLMRQFGLILENVDGFDNLAQKFVMRGVPHTLALSTSIAPVLDPLCTQNPCASGDAATIPPRQRTGWDGGGAPGSGTLREFATGAVRQHFTKRLNRVAGTDFRLPTDPELDAMEAFQLFTGRNDDPNLGTQLLRPSNAAAGQTLFNGRIQCFVCHLNAGARFVATQPLGNPAGNLNIDTGVENFPNPARTPGHSPFPRDGGFGTAGSIAAGFGNGSFNVPPAVEAADTGPFFHNNAVNTIEDAVLFYNSTQFNASPAAALLRPDGVRPAIAMTAQEATQIAVFLRVQNALENIRATQELIDFVKANPNGAKNTDLLTLAIAENDDASSDLAAPSGQISAAATHDLATSRQTIVQAKGQPPAQRGAYIDIANSWLNLAKGELLIHP